VAEDISQHVFISDSRLYLRRGGKTEEIESQFARQNLEDYERRKSVRGWKSGGEEDGIRSFSLWGKQADGQGYSGFRFLAVAPAGADAVYYLISNRHATGLFLYSLKDQEERRLFHKNEFHCFGVDFSPKREELACAVQEEDGAVNLNLYGRDGRFKSSLTGGDSFDSEPSFSRNNPDIIYYQTAGIARHEAGSVLALGPASVQRLNLQSGEIEEVVGHDDFDFLQPRDDREGNVYCIRRPYQRPGGFHPLLWLGNVILFPFRFLGAVMGFLQVFTHMFGEKPKRLGPDYQLPEKDKYIMVLGRFVNLAKLTRPKNEEDHSLVSADHELVRIYPNGDMEVLAKNVSGYDVGEDGVVHYTNGFRVQAFDSVRNTVVFKHPVIESLRLF